MPSTVSDFFSIGRLVSVGLPRSSRLVGVQVFIFADAHGETARHDHIRMTQRSSVHMQFIMTMTRVPPPSRPERITEELAPLALSMMEIKVVAPPVQSNLVFPVHTPAGTDVEGRIRRIWHHNRHEECL